MLKKVFFVYLLMILCVIHAEYAEAYIDEETHPAITEMAIEKSGLDNFLIKYLGVPFGIDQQFTNSELTELFPQKTTQSVLEWLRFGSKYEDVGERAKNHFYDPTRNSGVDDVAIGKKGKDRI